MKDKKIKQILKDVDDNLSSLSKEITESLFDDTPKTKRVEEKRSVGVDFQSYHKPEKIEFDPQPKELDLVESLAKNISANLLASRPAAFASSLLLPCFSASLLALW